MKSLLILLILALAGCSSGPALRDYSLPESSVELDDTPFFSQSKYQCGPAALATVLGANGLVVSPEELRSHIYLPGRQGSLQAEIVAATRRYDRVPYVLEPDFDALLTEVAGGTPVLVMQNLGLRLLPQWHYAVVIGYDTPSDSLLLRSGTNRRLRMHRVRFQATWARADNWAMIAVSPDSPPPTAHYGKWLQSASDFEELGQQETAARAYEAATRLWPGQPLTWQALANARYAMKDLRAAEVALRRSLHLEKSAAGHNNLAHILHQRGCLVEAAAEISRADAMADSTALTEVLAGTRAAIEADGDDNTNDCRPDEFLSVK